MSESVDPRTESVAAVRDFNARQNASEKTFTRAKVFLAKYYAKVAGWFLASGIILAVILLAINRLTLAVGRFLNQRRRNRLDRISTNDVTDPSNDDYLPLVSQEAKTTDDIPTGRSIRSRLRRKTETAEGGRDIPDSLDPSKDKYPEEDTGF